MTQKKSNHTAILAALAIAVAAVFLWRTAVTTDPARALAKTVSALENGEMDEVLHYAEIATRGDLTAHWAWALQGRAFEKLQRPEQALEAYRQIPSTAAAYPDALLGILRTDTASASRQGDKIALADVLIRNHKRRDLLQALLLIRATHAEAAADLEQAYALYRDVRLQYPVSEEAAIARAAMERLQTAHPGQFGEDGLPELHDQAKLLLREGKLTEALRVVQKIKSIAVKDATAHLEAQLIEEKILRRQKRAIDADRLLMLVAADGSLGTADIALLRAAKNAWNENDQHRALSFLEKLHQRFPNSSVINEAQYIEARILEELNLFVEARELYRAISTQAENKQSMSEDAIRAHKRLAWLYYRGGTYIQAAQEFYQVATLAEDLAKLPPEDPNRTAPALIENPTPSQMAREWQHATYWLASSLAKLDDKAKAETKLTQTNPSALWSALRTNAPRSYYAVLAETRLREQNTPVTAITPDGDPLRCSTHPVPETLTKTLEVLRDVSLTRLAEREIDFFFGDIPSNAPLAKPATRAKLYGAYGRSIRAISYAEFTLHEYFVRQMANRNTPAAEQQIPTEAVAHCIALLDTVSFPLPYAEEFRAASSTHDISLALLAGIARTESHFNPMARSSADARGIMQLIPRTAAHEGEADAEKLFIPERNIELGSKHIAGLLKKYESNIPYALAAYNAGTPAVNRWRSRNPRLSPEAWTELISYPETNNYVKKIHKAAYFYTKRLNAEKAAAEALSKQDS